ncbi:hypothetical protein DWG18_00555 [Lysobacter sp. TY2-98]|nr:hypothetical protein DWG18_00555 [Lysobacter sp. TY2-98]
MPAAKGEKQRCAQFEAAVGICVERDADRTRGPPERSVRSATPRDLAGASGTGAKTARAAVPRKQSVFTLSGGASGGGA